MKDIGWTLFAICGSLAVYEFLSKDDHILAWVLLSLAAVGGILVWIDRPHY